MNASARDQGRLHDPKQVDRRLEGSRDAQRLTSNPGTLHPCPCPCPCRGRAAACAHRPARRLIGACSISLDVVGLGGASRRARDVVSPTVWSSGGTAETVPIQIALAHVPNYAEENHANEQGEK
jgi:hypothetical protein